MIFLVRHGETDWNDQKRIQGINDIPLNVSGKRQAARLAEALRCKQFAAYIASPLSRAFDTAAVISNDSSIIETDSRLKERYFGSYEGKTEHEITHLLNTRYNASLQYLDSSFDWFGDPEVETIEAVTKRSNECLDDLHARFGDNDICVVTHGGVIKTIFDVVLGIDPNKPRRYIIPNGVCLKLKKRHGYWYLVSFSPLHETDHNEH